MKRWNEMEFEEEGVCVCTWCRFRGLGITYVVKESDG